MPLLTTKIPRCPLLRLLYTTSSCTAAIESRDQKLNRIADDLLALTKAERKDYSTLFRHKLGLTQWVLISSLAAASAASATGPTGGEPATEEKKEEKMVFDIKLVKFEAAAKIKVIKEVRALTDLGLKEVKDLVEKAPVVIKKGVLKEEAEGIVAKLKEIGADAVLE